MRRPLHRPLRRWLVAAVTFAAVAVAASGCGSSEATDATPPESTTTSTMADVAPEPAAPVAAAETTVFEFAGPGSTTGWTTVDDSVMGGVSASRVGWENGSLVFAGVVTTDNNGGFVSALGPSDPAIGERARGSDAIGVGARLDRGPVGRYLLWLRTADSRRWVAEFTPLSARDCCLVILPWAQFTQVDRFLRPVAPSVPIEPTEIVQMGIYLLPDVRRVDFVLTIDKIVTGVMLSPSS